MFITLCILDLSKVFDDENSSIFLETLLVRPFIPDV